MSWSLLGVKGLKKRQQQKEKQKRQLLLLWDNYINVHTEKVVVFLFHIIL